MSVMARTDQGRIKWLQPPVRPLLEQEDLHLWRVDLNLIGQTADLKQILSIDERARYHRLLSPEKRASFLAGRASLRVILAKYLHHLPQAIRFEYNGTGKPFLANSKCASNIRFNLSHSGQWMVMGVSKEADLGVDIEEVRPVKKTWALEKLFTIEERESIAELPEEEKDAAFIAAWTEKEAAAKVNGAGLSGNRAVLMEYRDVIKKQADHGFTFFRKDSCWFVRFEPAPEYLGCAVLKSDKFPRVKFYEFSFSDLLKDSFLNVQPLINGEG
jgi:4'-phosphopantetheinyl transferase